MLLSVRRFFRTKGKGDGASAYFSMDLEWAQDPLVGMGVVPGGAPAENRVGRKGHK
jgi:hypothetical protein